MSANLTSECLNCGIELSESTMKYHSCKKKKSGISIYKKLNYNIQELVLEKLFKENVKKNKEDLIEELNEEFWIIFDKQWEMYFSNNLLFSICLEVMPYEVLIHKPLKSKTMDLCIKVDNVDISNLFYYDSEAPHNEYFCNILYGSDCDFTYGDLVEIINDQCNNYINYIKEEYDEDIQIGDHRFLEILELKKVENIRDFETYQVEFFMGS